MRFTKTTGRLELEDWKDVVAVVLLASSLPVLWLWWRWRR